VDAPTIVVTGFEPFGAHTANPSAELAKAVDGRRVGDVTVRSAVLRVRHAAAEACVAALLDEHRPVAVLHLGLAEGRARLALERVAINVMDYRLPDSSGFQPAGQPCLPGGPPAYFSTLPLGAIVAALTAEGIPAYLSNTAGTYLCNETLYTTLHEIHRRGLATRAGFLHLPLLPGMVAAAGLELPSMDPGLMVRGVELALRVIAETAQVHR
jgi:pyroglutamyl-peptidase